VVSITLLPLYLRGKGPQYPLNRRLGGPQSLSERCGDENYLLLLPGIELRPLGRPARSQSTYRLNYPGSQITTAAKIQYDSNIYYLRAEATATKPITDIALC
jgi:hypothetical protein